MTPDLPLLDLDGLIRHWKGTGTREGERLAGLPDGALEAACTLPGYILAQLGVLADEQWADAIRDHLISQYGPSARKAIPTWRADRGETGQHMPVQQLPRSWCTRPARPWSARSDPPPGRYCRSHGRPDAPYR